MRCVDPAGVAGISDGRLLDQLTAYRGDVAGALTHTCRWHKDMVAVIVVCLILLVALPAALKVMALAGFIALPILMGRKPQWQHAYDDLPPHVGPPTGTAPWPLFRVTPGPPATGWTSARPTGGLASATP